jgi:hypothetical protein
VWKKLRKEARERKTTKEFRQRKRGPPLQFSGLKMAIMHALLKIFFKELTMCKE